MMDAVTLVGSGAALCSMVSFVPQAWKIIRTGEVKDISPYMYAFTVTGFALWVTYGLLRTDWPIIVTNSVCFLLSGFILAMTLMPKSWRRGVKRAAGAKAQ